MNLFNLGETYALIPDLFKVAGEAWGIWIPTPALIPAFFSSAAAVAGASISFRLWCFPPHTHRIKLSFLIALFIALVIALLVQVFASVVAEPIHALTGAQLGSALLVLGIAGLLLCFPSAREARTWFHTVLAVCFVLGGTFALIAGPNMSAGVPSYMIHFLGNALVLVSIAYTVVLTHRLCEPHEIHTHTKPQTAQVSFAAEPEKDLPVRPRTQTDPPPNAV